MLADGQLLFYVADAVSPSNWYLWYKHITIWVFGSPCKSFLLLKLTRVTQGVRSAVNERVELMQDETVKLCTIKIKRGFEYTSQGQIQ